MSKASEKLQRVDGKLVPTKKSVGAYRKAHSKIQNHWIARCDSAYDVLTEKYREMRDKEYWALRAKIDAEFEKQERLLEEEFKDVLF